MWIILSVFQLVNGGDPKFDGGEKQEKVDFHFLFEEITIILGGILCPGSGVEGRCGASQLGHCTEQLTRALDRHDLGFVTTEVALTSLCRYKAE